jgi:NADH:ubiquinone oxidoreductase subunit F (NADH-binding)
VSALLDSLSATQPRLLPREPLGLAAFGSAYGERPAAGERLLAAVEASGLAGRGGAGFPTARKLRSVRARRGVVVVANGTEGEPVSAKDKALLDRNPHLVLDGALVAAELVRATRIVVAVGREGSARHRLEDAVAERHDADHVRIVAVPDRFVAGEESALVHWLNGGEAKPTIAPPRPFERGVDGRPTLVQNVETLANLALIARRGAAWFRRAGTAAEPGTALATVSGAVTRPGVVEVPLGLALTDLLARCGGLREPVQAFLVGGYFGAWVPARRDLQLSRAGLAGAGGTLGARAVVALGECSCGVIETARVVAYMASESALQCGPCLFGLRALEDRLATVAAADAGARTAFAELERLDRQIAKRGACAHPDGVLGFVASATRVFRAEFERHLAGHCSASDHRPVLPTPHREGGWR